MLQNLKVRVSLYYQLSVEWFSIITKIFNMLSFSFFSQCCAAELINFITLSDDGCASCLSNLKPLSYFYLFVSDVNRVTFVLPCSDIV